MKLIVTFSGRREGNCKSIANFIAYGEDQIVDFQDLFYHNCSKCNYECFNSECKYSNDDIYRLYKSMLTFDKVFLIVPMYCGNPSSLYFIFNERCQDFFTRNADKYDEFLSKLYIVGIYGSKEESPNFIPCLEGWFINSKYKNRVLGIERRKYNQTMTDNIVSICEVKSLLTEFTEQI